MKKQFDIPKWYVDVYCKEPEKIMMETCEHYHHPQCTRQCPFARKRYEDIERTIHPEQRETTHLLDDLRFEWRKPEGKNESYRLTCEDYYGDEFDEHGKFKPRKSKRKK